MTQLVNCLFSLFLLLLVVSCTTVETVSPPQQINVDIYNEQLKDLKKRTQFLEEEIAFLKNELSYELSLIKEKSTETTVNYILTDSERLAYQESFELIRQGDYEAAQIAFSNYIKS